MKPICDLRCCSLDLDHISMINFICEAEFKTKPNWVFSHTEQKNGHVSSFTAIISINFHVVGIGSGQNKKEAKYEASKAALSIIAPNVFAEKFPGHPDFQKQVLKQIDAHK